MIHLRCVTLVSALLAAVPHPAEAAPLTIVVDGEVGAPAIRALAELDRTMRARGIDVRRADRLADADAPQLVIGTAQGSPFVKASLVSGKLDLAEAAESLCVKKIDGGKRLVVAGRDARGLAYALWDLARHVESGGEPLAVDQCAESPAAAHRSVAIHLFNRDLEEDWYFDEAFWRSYFAMLASQRFNAFSLTFADHTNYLNPPYPFLVESPGYPDVRIVDKRFRPEERARNLLMLKTISDLAADHGLTFIFSVWMQKAGIKRDLIGESLVAGLPEAPAEHAEFCARGLAAVLKACPSIGGVQFRMNDESGVPAAQQKAFYARQFQAIADCGRPIRLDLRFKGLLPETIDAAIDLGLDVAVSTKFWTEHTGLPFHATESDPRHRWGRYGYADMLPKPRRYRTFFRLWTAGTQRLLLWGDPEYAARFVRSCSLSGSEGFEIFAMPANKGYGDQPGKWPILTDRSYVQGRWEFERYWAFYFAYGRGGYSPDGWETAWNRELRLRFGPAAGEVGRAYRNASQILPLVNAARLDSASEFHAWPEMSPGGPLDEYAAAIPSDTGLFYGIRRGKSAEFAFEGPGYVDAVLQKDLRAKWTPFDVAARLDQLAAETRSALDQAGLRIERKESPEWKITELDLGVLADLARFHAGKMRAATHAELFRKTRESGRLPVALDEMQRAASAWERIAQRTDGVYHDRMRFLNVDGHWKDRLPLVRSDIRRLEQLVAENPGAGPFERLPGEEPLDDPPVVEHEPVTRIRSDKDLKITVKVASRRPLARVILLHRPVNQRLDWKEIAMQPVGGGLYEASISSKEITARFDHLYRIEALLPSGRGALWPSWETRDPYVVVRTEQP